MKLRIKNQTSVVASMLDTSALLGASACLLVLAACTTSAPATAPTAAAPEAQGSAACAALMRPIDAALIGLPSSGATITSAALMSASDFKTGPFQLAVTPALPQFCKVLGRIEPVDPASPPIEFEVNLPIQWNGRALQYGGGGFNGTLVTGLGVTAAERLDQPGPLARGYLTVGTDSGHQTAPGGSLQAFALDQEALVNFAYASYKKVHDVAVELARRRFGRAPDRYYFMGLSEGGREGLVMAQRFPSDVDGVVSRVPVINWTGLQHAGWRNGLALRGEGWLPPAKVKLVADAVRNACDAADGLRDGFVADAASCRERFDITRLRCPAGVDAANCLTDAQALAVVTLQSPYRFDFDLANGVRSYPGYGLSGEDAPGRYPAGGWSGWWSGSAAPQIPPTADNGRAWLYGSGAIQYFFARDPKADLLRYRPDDFRDRVREVSQLMDATDPNLSAFAARGGKLIMMENMSDYAQSPFAGIEYFNNVIGTMGRPAVDSFARLYLVPGADHIGEGAPGNVDMLDVLSAWVEQGKAPGPLEVVMQERVPPFAVTRSLPLCRWPAHPHYSGRGDPSKAANFGCR